MRIVRVRILASLLAAFCALGTACSCSSGSRAGRAAEVVIPVQRATVPELVDTLSAAIRHRQHNTVMALYTPISASAVRRSINAGLGTAGSIDDLILLEFETIEETADQNVEIIGQFGSRLEIRLPSGRRIYAALSQEDGGWAIDVLASPGGEILLLTD